jgi:hypothetical protein
MQWEALERMALKGWAMVLRYASKLRREAEQKTVLDRESRYLSFFL